MKKERKAEVREKEEENKGGMWWEEEKGRVSPPK